MYGYSKTNAAAKVLAATGLPGDPALKYLECLDDTEAFKKNEYMPLIEHHEDCEGEEETGETTGNVLLRPTQSHPTRSACEC